MLLQEWGHLTGEATEKGKPRQLPLPLIEPLQQVVLNSEDCATKVNVHQGVWSVLMTPLYSENTVRGAVAVLRDVSEEYRLEKMRKDFVANVSHELRTPLAMLQGYSEALLDDIADSPEQRRELAQVILDESLRMGRLVNNLLDLAKMEAGTFAMNMAPLEMKQLINRVIRKFTTMSRDRNIRLVAELDNKELLLANGDEDRLEQVLTNLVDNAIRHSEADTTIVLKGFKTSWLEREAIAIEVVDQGEGILEEDLPYVFDRFYKADKARKRTHSVGTGLGLAIVKNIVEAHQGVVKAESTKGQGTTFSFIIPAK
jgi:two-component system sensor histidine kinase ResE